MSKYINMILIGTGDESYDKFSIVNVNRYCSYEKASM